MFKFVMILAVLGVAAAKPGFLSAPLIETRSALIGETTVESHGNSVIHGAAPAITSYAAVAPVAAAPVVAAAPIATAAVAYEKTVESHGNAVVHGAAPVVTGYAAAPAAPVYFF